MITIKRDYRSNDPHHFQIRLNEEGKRGITYYRVTLQQTQAAVAHYYVPEDASHQPADCLICQRLAAERAQEERRAARKMKQQR